MMTVLKTKRRERKTVVKISGVRLVPVMGIFSLGEGEPKLVPEGMRARQ